MNKYLSIIFLYYRAGIKKIGIVIGIIPLTLFLMTLINMYEVFNGIMPVIIFIVANLLTYVTVAGSLSGKKDMKATHATTGYTMRRLRLSSTASYLTSMIYYFLITLMLWGTAILSIYIFNRINLTLAGCENINMQIALFYLRTDIGHILIPFAHPQMIAFNIMVMLTMSAECAKSCYLTWHNGSPSAGVVLIIVMMVYVWGFKPEDTFLVMAIILCAIYGVLSFLDIIFREKNPKGDPFKINQYAGIMDMNDTGFDEDTLMETNTELDDYEEEGGELKLLTKYGRTETGKRGIFLKHFNPLRLRRRFLPLGSNLEKANMFFGVCITAGVAEHLLFFGRYRLHMNAIELGIKGVTLAANLKMPPFWELESQTYYGYILAIILVLAVQSYWNYAYYNKETKIVYVMKRLPDQKEYTRTIWVAPAIEAAIIIVIMIIHTLIDFGLYITTPAIAL